MCCMAGLAMWGCEGLGYPALFLYARMVNVARLIVDVGWLVSSHVAGGCAHGAARAC